jgi:hypothetical protein
VTFHWKGLEENYNFVVQSISIKAHMQKLWSYKVSNTLLPWRAWLLLGGTWFRLLPKEPSAAFHLLRLFSACIQNIGLHLYYLPKIQCSLERSFWKNDWIWLVGHNDLTSMFFFPILWCSYFLVIHKRVSSKLSPNLVISAYYGWAPPWLHHKVCKLMKFFRL